MLRVEPASEALDAALEPRLDRLDRRAGLRGDLRRRAVVIEAKEERAL